MDPTGTSKNPLNLGGSILKSLWKVIEKNGFRREEIESKLFKKANFYPIIESYYDIIRDSLVLENLDVIETESILNFFKISPLKNIIGKIYAPNHLDPLGYYDINKIYTEFECLVLQYFRLEKHKTIDFTSILFEIMIGGCNETLTILNNDGDLSSQPALYNHNKFIEQYNKIKEFYKSLRKYTRVSDYLPRKVAKAENFSRNYYLFSDYQNYENIIQVTDKNKYIVLLSDAGVGKTSELKQLAYHYSRNRLYYPILVCLNKYTNKSISEYFPKYWELIPEEKLIILLDGLDEIENKNKNDAIREIGLFAENHPNTYIVISCRTNFYKIEDENIFGMSTLNGFTSYILLDLENKAIKKYVNDKLDFKSTYFFDSVYDKNLYPLLRSPFYLINLVKLYAKNNTLPKNKAEIFKNLLELRINLDITHYQTTKQQLDKEKINVMKNLEYVALAMECLGRNYIYNEELEEILPDSSSRELLEYCTTWIKQETDKVTWQFEHNNFQEYLAAKKLAKYPFKVIKEFISSGSEHKKISHSWTNTLSFLVSIYDADDLQKWILSVQPELFVKFEHEKISKKERIRIFKEIFESYEEKEIWIPWGKFRIDELARFGQSDEIVDYLLKKTENGAHFTTIGTAIDLLCEIKDIPTEYEDRAKNILIKRALETSFEGIVQNYALECLSVHKFDSKEIIDQIVPSLRRSEYAKVKAGLYCLLCNSDYLNDYIDIFLEGTDGAYSRGTFI